MCCQRQHALAAEAALAGEAEQAIAAHMGCDSCPRSRGEGGSHGLQNAMAAMKHEYAHVRLYIGSRLPMHVDVPAPMPMPEVAWTCENPGGDEDGISELECGDGETSDDSGNETWCRKRQQAEEAKDGDNLALACESCKRAE